MHPPVQNVQTENRKASLRFRLSPGNNPGNQAKNCFFAACDFYLFICFYPYTQSQEHRYGNQPASTCPLFAYYVAMAATSQNSPSLPRVCESQLAVETAIQSVSHSPFFPLHSSPQQRNSSASPPLSLCVHAEGNSTDELPWRWQISGAVT